MIGEGPIPADVMIIGEFPGPDELKRGRPFIGKSGRELRRFLNGYTCPNERDVYMTNLKDEPPANKKTFVVEPHERDRLLEEIRQVQPSTIVTAGHHVLKYFCGEEATLETHHGIPHSAGAADIFPIYNPAAMLHSPVLQSVFAYDMRRLGMYLNGDLPEPATDTAPSDYTEIVGDALILNWRAGVDTEGWQHKPWGLSLSWEAGRGFVMRKSLLMFGPKAEITLHGSLHDLGVLRALGYDIDAMGIRFDDTMIMAYLLGIEPQGLKPLIYRHCGMLQDDYSDLVAIPSAAIATVWLEKLALTLDQTEKPKKLIDRMLKKDEPSTIRKRWFACKAREYLIEDGRHTEDDDPPEATLDDVEVEDAVKYAGRDADGTNRVFPILSKQIDAFGLRDVYETDIACVPMIDRMQEVGIEANVPYFLELAVMLKLEETIILDQIELLAGRRVNPNSGDQVAEILYGQLKLHERPEAAYLRLKKTKTKGRISTNDKILDALKLLHPLVELVQEGREVRKLRTTYCEKIPWLVRSDGRLHPNYRITRAETGRLTATKPNVLAFPKHSARGKLVRGGFRAGPGLVLGEWDLNQIEMRVFAHDSGDSRMVGQFLSGQDFHRSTAAGMYHKEDALETVSDHERFTAKAINFGTLMGITEFGLADQLHKAGLLDLTVGDCAERLQAWMRTYPGGEAYIDRKHSEARRDGFVRDMWGRLRWLEGVHSSDPYIAAEALRQAQATPVQSGAQGIIKRAMVTLWPLLKDLRARGRKVECLMQVHDALVMEYDPAHEQELDETVMFALTQSAQLAVPVTAKAVKSVLRLSDL